MSFRISKWFFVAGFLGISASAAVAQDSGSYGQGNGYKGGYHSRRHGGQPQVTYPVVVPPPQYVAPAPVYVAPPPSHVAVAPPVYSQTPPSMPPPPQRYERPSQRRGYVWVPGHFDWRRGQYVWISGHLERSQRGRRFQAARWERRGNQYVLIQGRWQ